MILFEKFLTSDPSQDGPVQKVYEKHKEMLGKDEMKTEEFKAS